MPGSYARTYTGRKFYPDKPEELDVHIIDIAHHLSLINRYNGALNVPYSVGHHSLLVEKIFHKMFPHALVEDRLAALLHDAEEAYLIDMISPTKKVITQYADLSNRVKAVIFGRMGLQLPLPEAITRIDTWIRDDEMWFLSSWGHLEVDSPYFNIEILPKSPVEIKNEFLLKFEELCLLSVPTKVH